MQLPPQRSVPRYAFAKLLAARGFDNAAAIYAEMQSQGAGFALDSNDFNAWGYALLRSGMVKESIGIFRFGTHMLPTDANLFDSLGEALAKAGLREESIRSYRRSLALDPKNTNAVARLKLLDATPERSAAAPGPTPSR